MCPLSQACSVVAAPRARQYPVTSACVAEFRPMTGDPSGSAGRFGSRTAPGGGTNIPRIALASAAARRSAAPPEGLPAGRLVTAGAFEEAPACGAEVTVPQPVASLTPRMKRNELGLLRFTPLRRGAPRAGSACGPGDLPLWPSDPAD